MTSSFNFGSDGAHCWGMACCCHGPQHSDFRSGALEGAPVKCIAAMFQVGPIRTFRVHLGAKMSWDCALTLNLHPLHRGSSLKKQKFTNQGCRVWLLRVLWEGRESGRREISISGWEEWARTVIGEIWRDRGQNSIIPQKKNVQMTFTIITNQHECLYVQNYVGSAGWKSRPKWNGVPILLMTCLPQKTHSCIHSFLYLSHTCSLNS
jgi:hypothetical protein